MIDDLLARWVPQPKRVYLFGSTNTQKAAIAVAKEVGSQQYWLPVSVKTLNVCPLSLVFFLSTDYTTIPFPNILPQFLTFGVSLSCKLLYVYVTETVKPFKCLPDSSAEKVSSSSSSHIQHCIQEVFSQEVQISDGHD